jgi:3-oxoacyl-[acyl-carrier-protein] synthase II
MGEESAGISAVDIAARRIRSGQSEVCLIGGSFNAERYEVFVDGNLGGLLWTGEPLPVWKRAEAGGGVCFGSGGAFLVLESREHAQKRGGRPYAELGPVLNDRGRRRPGEARATADRQFGQIAGTLRGPTPVISGAIGLEPATSEERAFLADHVGRGELATVRAPLSLIGACREAEFPMLLGLAALALHRGGFYQPFGDGIETPFEGVPGSVLVTCWGLWRGEGMGVVLPAGAGGTAA